MAIGYGLGIGLQAKPKDYVEILKAREAAAQKAKAAKAAKDEAAINRLNEKFTYKMGEGKVLPWQQGEKDKLIIEWEKIAQEEAEKPDPDFNRLTRFTMDAMSKMTDMRVQYDDAHKFFINPTKYGFTPEESQMILGERDPQKVADFASKKGVGITIVDNRFIPTAVDGYSDNTFDKTFYEWYRNVGDQSFDWGKEIKPSETGNVLGARYEYSGLSREAKDGFMINNANNPYLFREFVIEKTANTGKRVDLNDPNLKNEYTAYISEKYDKNAEALRASRTGYEGKKTIIQNITPGSTPSTFEMAPPTVNVAKVGGDYSDFGSIGVTATNMITPTQKGWVDQDNGRPANLSGGSFKFSKFLVVASDKNTIQYDKDFKSKGYPQKLSVATYGAYTQYGSSTPLSVVNVDPNVSAGISSQAMDAKEKASLDAAYNKAQNAVDEYNKLSDSDKKAVWNLRANNKNIIQAIDEYKSGKKASSAGKMKP